MFVCTWLLFLSYTVDIFFPKFMWLYLQIFTTYQFVGLPVAIYLENIQRCNEMAVCLRGMPVYEF